jgi:hypothetical protein
MLIAQHKCKKQNIHLSFASKKYFLKEPKIFIILKKSSRIFSSELLLKQLHIILTKIRRLRRLCILKGTWQRGGFSRVFAEIGSA